MALRVLLVDDNPQDRDLIARELGLHFEDLEIQHVRDWADFEVSLRQGHFDVVVTDCRLFWTSGADVLRRVKALDPDRPVLMFTASGSEELAVEAMKHGLDDYVTKTSKHYSSLPFAVRAALERADARRRMTSRAREMEDAHTRALEAERAAREAAEGANRQKDDFLTTLSHELRTPLHAMLGWLQMLETQALDTDRARHALRVIHRNARHQAQLIDDLLDLSRISSGRLDLERKAVSIPDLVESVIESVEGAAGTRGILLTRSVPPDVPSVLGDFRRLHQALGNVVGNAVKFTPPGGRVRLQISAADGQVRMEVRDTGVGIAPAVLPHVFERFRQGNGDATRGHGGLGLGLGIARFLIEAHGGTIAVASEGPGRGTTVRIAVPAVASAAPSPEPDARDAATGLAGVTVLIVDDHDDARAMLSALLEAHGAVVFQAESAETALARLASTSVSLLVADIAMPGMDGYELIRRVRGGSTRGPMAVAVSAYARPEDRDRALEAGYDAYCVKPVSQAELLRVIGDLQSREKPPAASPVD